jgi:hypothetical protein
VAVASQCQPIQVVIPRHQKSADNLIHISPMMSQVDMRTYARIEHFLAFTIFGAIFGIAYPGLM